MRSVNGGGESRVARGGFGGVSDFRAHAGRRGAPFPVKSYEGGATQVAQAVDAAPNVPSLDAEIARDRRKLERPANPAPAPIVARAGLTAPERGRRPIPGSQSAVRQSGR